MAKIYVLVDPRSGMPFYVGASGAEERYLRKRHEVKSREGAIRKLPNTHHLCMKRHRLIFDLLLAGSSFAIRYIDEVPADEAGAAEKQYFKLAQALGYKLLQDDTKFSYGSNIKNKAA